MIGVGTHAAAQPTLPTSAPNFGGAQVAPNRAESIARPLRYRPDGTDFVIHNGEAHFNRPLYAARTSFRVDAADRPEFVLNLPRKGGVLRLGVAGANPLWLHEAASVEMRYRPGAVIYTVRDPALAGTTLTVSVMALRERAAAVWRFEADGPLPGDLVWSFAGGSKRSANERNGDIIAGRDPIEIMPPTLAEVTGNTVVVGMDRYLNQTGAFDFVCTSPGATGAAPFEAWDLVPDPTTWTANAPVFQGAFPLHRDQPVILGLFHTEADAPFSQAYLGPLWEQTESDRAALTSRVEIESPDPFLNALPGALLVAADAVWQEPHVMHGAIAWRMPLLGWRGPAALDTLGWHDRFRTYARHWIAQQNVDPTDFPNSPAADPAKNLATDDWRALHGYGSIPARHYDMALGFVDLLLRHLMWTSDLDFAREVWPFLERHLEWEKRCFDREGLYEGYAAIWASDALTYNGGGTAHASAYNLWHREMAGRIADLIGADATPHRAEADRIRAAMQRRLWLEPEGTMAEYEERAGLRRPHGSAALWTFYHTMDSQAVSPTQAARMAQHLARTAVRIPVEGNGVPPGSWVLPTSNWKPYEWSLNNVVPSENAHTALALWQAGRPDLAWPLWQGTMLDAMVLGQSPGNIPNLSHYDVNRRETYRDFADPIGSFSRALVEGLFGVRPDGLEGTLTLAPGWPGDWPQATLRTPDFFWRYTRAGKTDTFNFRGELPGTRRVSFVVPVRGASVSRVALNGTALPVPAVGSSETRTVEVTVEVDPSAGVELVVDWEGATPSFSNEPPPGLADLNHARFVVLPAADQGTWTAVDLSPHLNGTVDTLFEQTYLTPRSATVSLHLPTQGTGSWSGFKVNPELDASGLSALAAAGPIALPGGGELHASAEIAWTSWWDNYPQSIRWPLAGQASHLVVLVAGSTTPMHANIDNGEIEVTYTDGTRDVLPLRNPTTWWPIERDYIVDDFAFRHPAPLPLRLALGTGQFYTPDGHGDHPTGGAATVLGLPLDPRKSLQSLELRALSTEVVVGLAAAALIR